MDETAPTSLSRLEVKPKKGDEFFNASGRNFEFRVSDFWRWSVSDLISNATRGRLAEFIVANALSISTEDVRDEWGAYDLLTPEGIKIEVKSAAYLQSWYQIKQSLISFRTPRTRAWNAETNRQEQDARRQAHVYVFALLGHRVKATLDPLDVDQWQFYVLPTWVLDARTRSQHSITLRTLETLSAGSVTYHHLRSKVLEAYESQKRYL